MKILSKKNKLDEISTDLLVLFSNTDGDDKHLSDGVAALDKLTGGQLSKLQAAGALPSKPGSIRSFYHLGGLQAKAVAVVGVENNRKGLEAAAAKISGYLRQQSISTAAVYVGDNAFDSLPSQESWQFLAQGMLSADYVCDTYKSTAKPRKPLEVVLLTDNDSQTKAVQKAVNHGTAIAGGMNLLKDLGNAPGNVCTPKYLAKAAKQLGKHYDSLAVTVYREREIEDMAMGSLLSVAKGSVEKPRLITINYQGGKGDPIVLVGKGVTFDTGGISLKPGAGMEEMKYDMCGAGSVLGTMQAVAEMQLPINVVGVIAAVENMPAGNASKPGDIVTSMSGKTIEILNTDAEGRLILCDAMTFAQQEFKPKAMIDIATLTGAVIIALGRQPSGMMSNNDALAAALIAAGDSSGDRVWQLPLWEEYREQLQSPFADLQNIGGREAGTVTAGVFLSEFAKDTPWAHLDIAGTAWKSGKNKGATGRPVPLLVQYLQSQIAAGKA